MTTDEARAALPDTGLVAAFPLTYRAIRASLSPPALLHDLLPGVDLESLAVLLALTDPNAAALLSMRNRLRHSDLPDGPGAGWSLVAFTSPARPSRFTDGSYGVWYCALAIETAVAETRFHLEHQLSEFHEPPQVVPFQILTAQIAGTFIDLKAMPPSTYKAIHAPADYSLAQGIGNIVRTRGDDGVVYDSVRHKHGTRLAVFRPRAIYYPAVTHRIDHSWTGDLLLTGVAVPVSDE